MQEMVINILFIAVLVVIAGTLFWDVRKKRNRLKTAQREEVELTENLKTKLPAGYTVLTDVYLLTRLGRSRVDFVILSPYGIFALEYRQLYIYIRADEELSRWTFAPGIKGKPFTSPLYQSKVHLHCIQELIGDKPGLKCYPMAAFPTIAEIELKNPTDTAFVGLVSGVIPFIEKWHDEACLTPEEISAIAELLTLNSEKVKEMEKPEPEKETPEEYKAFIPGDFRDPEEDDEDWEDDEEGEEEEEGASEDETSADTSQEQDAAHDAADGSDQDDDERK